MRFSLTTWALIVQRLVWYVCRVMVVDGACFVLLQVLLRLADPGVSHEFADMCVYMYIICIHAHVYVWLNSALLLPQVRWLYINQDINIGTMMPLPHYSSNDINSTVSVA
jgi:hypothetical protein